VITFNGTRWSAPVTVDAGNDMDVFRAPPAPSASASIGRGTR
jgi:hypothetical protein